MHMHKSKLEKKKKRKQVKRWKPNCYLDSQTKTVLRSDIYTFGLLPNVI